nr:MAG TPA: hypothetical protein [Caudoviricetes sp.]
MFLLHPQPASLTPRPAGFFCPSATPPHRHTLRHIPPALPTSAGRGA